MFTCPSALTTISEDACASEAPHEGCSTGAEAIVAADNDGAAVYTTALFGSFREYSCCIVQSMTCISSNHLVAALWDSIFVFDSEILSAQPPVPDSNRFELELGVRQRATGVVYGVELSEDASNKSKENRGRSRGWQALHGAHTAAMEEEEQLLAWPVATPRPETSNTAVPGDSMISFTLENRYRGERAMDRE